MAKVTKQGVSDLSIFHPYMLGLKPPSQVYLEGLAGNYLNSIVRGDPVVKEAIAAVAVAREEVWSRKFPTICECRDIYNEVEESCMIASPLNTYNFEMRAELLCPILRNKQMKL